MGLFDLFSNDTAEKAADQRKAGLQQGYDALSTQYGQGQNALNTNYGNASDLYKNLITSYTPGATAYGDASGANGAAGTAKAYDAFKNSGAYGGFKFANETGLDAISRLHAAAGNLNSGNADTDAAKFTTGLAGNTWNNYVSGLAPYLTGQGTATAGAAGVDTGLGNASAGLYAGQGNAANANYTGQGNADAAATMNNYNVGKNQLGALTAGAQLIAGMPPTSLSGIGGAPTVGGTSLGGPNGPTPTTGGLFSMFS